MGEARCRSGVQHRCRRRRYRRRLRVAADRSGRQPGRALRARRRGSRGRYGLAYAIPVSVGSMLAFNFLFLPPVHTFALRESENWVALAVYLTVGVVVGELATRSRRLAHEPSKRRRFARPMRSRPPSCTP